MNAREHIDWFNHLGREARYDLVSIAAIMIITNTFQVIYPFMMLFGVYIFAKYFGKVIFHAFNSINDWNVEKTAKKKLKTINIGAEIRTPKTCIADGFAGWASLVSIKKIPQCICVGPKLNTDKEIICALTHETIHFVLFKLEDWYTLDAFDNIDSLKKGICFESCDGKLGEEVNG